MAALFCSAIPPRPKKAITPLLLPSLPPNYHPISLADHEAMVSDFDLFWRSVVNFHYQIGTQFTVGAVGKKTLDLHRLYCEVTKRDGYHKVTDNRKWKEVAVALQVSSTSISSVLKKEYLNSLYLFERVHFKTTGADSAVIQPATADSQPVPVLQVQTGQPSIQAMPPVGQVSAAAPAPPFQAALVLMPVPAVSQAASAPPIQAVPIRQVQPAAAVFQLPSVSPPFQAAPVMQVPAAQPVTFAAPIQAVPVRQAYQRAEFEDKVRHQKEREEYQKKMKTAAKSGGTQPVTGRVEAEFTGGYFVSVQVGSETLKGVVFHSTATVAPPAATVAQPNFDAMMELATAAVAQADQAQIPASSSG